LQEHLAAAVVDQLVILAVLEFLDKVLLAALETQMALLMVLAAVVVVQVR
jgi:hypothetical protein